MSVAEVEQVERPARSRLALMQRTLEQREAEREQIGLDLERLASEEDEAVAEAARKAPTKRIFVMGSAAQRAREKAEKLRGKLPSLAREIHELTIVLDEAKADAARAELEQAAAEAVRLGKRERELIGLAGELTGGLVKLHAELVATVEAKDALYVAATRSPLWGALSEQERTKLERSTQPLLQPFPTSVTVLIGQLAGVCLGREQQAWRKDPVSARPPVGQVLLELTRDLSGVARSPSLSGRIERK
jgi:hypothetical protein